MIEKVSRDTEAGRSAPRTGPSRLTIATAAAPPPPPSPSAPSTSPRTTSDTPRPEHAMQAPRALTLDLGELRLSLPLELVEPGDDAPQAVARLGFAPRGHLDRAPRPPPAPSELDG